MDTIKEFDILDEQVFNDIKEYVGNMNLKFENSLLYDGVEKKKLHDETKRKSIFCNITDNGLFDRFEKLIGKVNELVEGKKYTLVRNDVMYIKYKEGDFFESHTDFLTFKTNLFQEYTFILCLDAECVGGETVFTVNPFFKHKSPNSVQSGKSVMFRKDLFHEGSPITLGHKHILVVNLLEVDTETDGYVVFKAKDTPEGKIITVTKSKIRAFPSKFKTWLLEQPDRKIHFYEFNEGNHEVMEFITKILRRCHVTLEDYDKYKDFVSDCEIGVDKLIIDSDVSSVASFDSTTDYEWKGKDIIIFEDAEKTDYYLQNIVKPNGLKYIPFNLVFAEGQYGVTGDGGNSHEEGVNVLLQCVGELDYIIESIKPYIETYNRCSKVDCDDSKYLLDDYLDDDPVGHGSMLYEYNMNVFTGPSYLTNNVLNDYYSSRENIIKQYNKIKDTYNFKEDPENKLPYTLDENTGVMGFTEKQKEHIMKRWGSVLTGIKMKLPESVLSFPQIMYYDESRSLCNETYYGEYTFVQVTGLFRME